MSIEKVKAYFSAAGMESRVMELPISSATVELAAKALGCEPSRIAKTLSFNVNGKAVLVVTAGDARIDNKKFKAFFSLKAKFLTPDEVLQWVGHAIGGVCPFAINDGVDVYLDVSLRRFEIVYPACGSSNSAIALTIPELEHYSDFLSWVDICKDWEINE